MRDSNRSLAGAASQGSNGVRVREDELEFN
jgi:hypothetical protein